MTTLYRCFLKATEKGLEVGLDTWTSIEENPRTYFCVHLKPYKNLDVIRKKAEEYGLTIIKAARNMGYRVRYLHKKGSAFAQPTVEEALEKLILRKQNRIKELKTELALLEILCEADLKEPGLLPDTQDIVGENSEFLKDL